MALQPPGQSTPAPPPSEGHRPGGIAAVIFDMDGLMIDSESVYWAAGRAVAQRFGKTVADQTLGRMMGRKPVESMQVFKEELGLKDSPEHLLEMRDSMVLETLRGPGVPPMPGLYEALDALRPRFRLAVATSAPRAYVDIIFDKLGLGGRFEVIQTSDDIVHGKPDPEIYLKAMDRLGVPPGRCAVLEDSRNGALAGKRAGAYVIAVPSVYTRDQDFSFADFVAGDLREAVARIEAVAG